MHCNESILPRIEVFDDDGKKGPDSKDKLLGTAYYSLRELEASATVRSPLQVTFPLISLFSHLVPSHILSN